MLLDRDDQDLGQWRIKVEVEELSLDCQAAQLTLLEEGRPKQELCGTRQKAVTHFLLMLVFSCSIYLDQL